MKPVPPEVLGSGPAGTDWYGGAVDRIAMSLRVHAPVSQFDRICELLACPGEPNQRNSGLHASEVDDGDTDRQLSTLLARCSSDVGAWQMVSSQWKVDLFCGLFLERPNRAVSLSVTSMRLLSERGIEIGFDIYSPEK